MGYSLQFHRFKNGDAVDADREGLREFLAARGLVQQVDPRYIFVHLLESDGSRLTFDGAHESDLYVDALDSPKRVGGGIPRAQLISQELRFVYELCVAAGWSVVNPQSGGDRGPQILVPGRNHSQSDMDVMLERTGMNSAFVDSPEELEAGLHGNEWESIKKRREQAAKSSYREGLASDEP